MPNIHYKLKWDTAETHLEWRDYGGNKYVSGRTYKTVPGDCASIPYDKWSFIVMTVMVYVDFIVSSLLPFIIMVYYNSRTIAGLYRSSSKVNKAM